MLKRITADDWKIIENGFSPETNRFFESIFSLGNEHMGLRGFFEEGYSGDSLQGTYVAGIYYPDPTKVGWWKIGYPDYYAKVINSINWIGIGVDLEGRHLDLAKGRVRDFKRELDMKKGCLSRTFTWIGKDGQETRFAFNRFLSMADTSIACISVKAVPLNYSGNITFHIYLDGNVQNEDTYYGESFWDEVNKDLNEEYSVITMRTKKTDFYLSAASRFKLVVNDRDFQTKSQILQKTGWVGYKTSHFAERGKSIEIQKFVSVVTSRDHEKENLEKVAIDKLAAAYRKGYTKLFNEHVRVMEEKWENSDISIAGDIEAQQGIRYCIFQLNQTYSGKDPRLNIGPKGFSGEKYGGATYWDTEAFCLPFYLYTKEEAARNLLHYRYLQLKQARENAGKLGLKGALFPMVTMDGHECHNEWEITFEEIHRNGAIAYAIYNYTNYTGNESYLFAGGIEILIEISRFWAYRVSYSQRKECYMILGVTGPNEYENNVNNNWYTNTIAAWTLEYTLESLIRIGEVEMNRYRELEKELDLREEEKALWRDIIERMYFPYVDDLDIFEQNDLYMDKEQTLVSDLDPKDLPLNKHWSWDRILRSCFVKQADVIQGIYFFPERYNQEEMTRNFNFYEPRTVHESSLSASIYSIVASRIGYRKKAYELYLRTARLDLENYNDDTEDGVHITSMAGSWLAIVQGFAGMSVQDGQLKLSPYVPEKWDGYSFKIAFRGRRLKIDVKKNYVEIEQIEGEPLKISIFNRGYHSQTGKAARAPIQE